MKMKATMLAFALAAILLSGIAQASVNPKLQLLNYSMSEVPALPGHTLALTLFFKSMESDNCAERVAVQVAVSHPLSVRGSDTKYIDSLCFRDPDSKGTVTFMLPVDNLATAGTYPVSVATSYEKRFTKLSESNTVNVQVGGKPEIEASVTSSTPVDIYPGDTAKVTITFQNTGSSMVQSSRATADSGGIGVKWAGQTQDVGQIASHGMSTATFTLEAPKNLRAGAYPLNVRLDYVAQDKSTGTAQFIFEVPVKPKADYEAVSASGDLLPGQKKEVTITLTNTGTENANRLKVRIKPTFPFSTDGTVRYVESLPKGQGVNLTYTITVDKDATAGGQLLGFMVDFEDPQGKKFADTADFSMKIRTMTLEEELYSYWYVGVVVVLAGAYMLLKGRKKKGIAAA